MKKLFRAFAVIRLAILPLAAMMGCASAVLAATPAPLTSLHAIHSLSHAEAAKDPPVAFEATVNYRRAGETTLFVQDGGEGIYVYADASIRLAPGDRVLVRGKAADSFRPIAFADSVTVVGHPGLPVPVPATFDELTRSEHDCVRVAVKASVLSADLALSGGVSDIHMILLSDGGIIDAYVDSGDVKFLDQLLDADVEVAGVAQQHFDGKMDPTGVALSIPSIEDIKVLKRADASPWSLPIAHMSEILTNYRVKNLSQRVRVEGTITYYQPGSAIVLQNGDRSLWIRTVVERPIRVGDRAEITGFPDERDGFMTLAEGEIQESPVYTPIAPLPSTMAQLTGSKQVFDLVSIEAKVVMEVRENLQDEYVLVADGQVFSAIYRHPSVAGLTALPMNNVPLGSKVRVAGICVLQGSNPWIRQVPFNLLMRTPDDIAVIARPSLLTVNNLIIVAGLLLVGFLAVGARGWAIEHRVRRQTALLAYIERRRRRILEDINGSRPLAEIIEQITELVSFKLKGSPCWCQITDGAQLGVHPENPTAMRIVKRDIPARSGPPLGELFAAFDPLTKPRDIESEALALAAELATLAIETRRLYSDLLRRSEFDLLTDINNRFSLEKRLDAQIEDARQRATIFGLIYIDLDHFKQINDFYGHRIGDLYLQQVALRMKDQIRSVDTLARLGGDEFAVLLPVARNREDCEEVAHRLERCFDDPFSVAGNILECRASIGVALYPENGATRDSLLNAADAAMYQAKRNKKPVEPIPAG